MIYASFSIKLLIHDASVNMRLFFLAGDEIFSINSVPVQGMTHQEAIGLFKEVKKGPVVVTIGRRTSTASMSASNLSIKTLNINGNLQFPATNETEE